MSGTTPLKVTTAKRDALNLSVIQRHDPSCVHIAHTVTHTVAYEFVSGGWQKLNVEGSLFLVQRYVLALSRPVARCAHRVRR